MEKKSKKHNRISFKARWNNFTTQRLISKNTFYTERVSLYQDYEIEKRKDYDNEIEFKTDCFRRKLWQNYSEICYKANDKSLIYEYLTRLEKEKLEMKLRLEYRKHREDNRREQNKLIAKNDPDKEAKILALDSDLADHLELNQIKVNELLIARKAAYDADVKSGKISADAYINLKHEKFMMEQSIADFHSLQKLKFDHKYEEFLVKNAKVIEKYKKKLELNSIKLKNRLEETKANNYVLPEDICLRVEHLCMFFGGVKAVNDLSFDVKKGEIFGLIGPNGAGKTTVFNCITQFYKPTSGNLYFQNRLGETVDLTREKVHNVILQGIVRTFQNLEVIKEISVLDNLLVAAHRQFHTSFFTHMFHFPILGREEKVIRARADKVLHFMGLQKYRNYYAYGLPYGILKKIEIARTLMCSPQLIILDEPAAGLNDAETKDLSELIRVIQKEYNCTILLVEHDMGLVMEVCDTICAISFGSMLAIGTAEEIQNNRDVQTAYLGVSEDE